MFGKFKFTSDLRRRKVWLFPLVEGLLGVVCFFAFLHYSSFKVEIKLSRPAGVEIRASFDEEKYLSPLLESNGRYRFYLP